MDTVTHIIYGAVCGLVVSKATPNISPWKMATVGAIGGLFPDLDFVMNFISSEFYLRNHRAATHSLFLAPVYAMMLALLWCNIWKNSLINGNPFNNSKKVGTLKLIKSLFIKDNYSINFYFIWFSFVSLSAIYTHVFMDYITSFGTMFMWPFSYYRYEFASIFIIDLLLSAIGLITLILAVCVKQKNKIALFGYICAFLYIGLAYNQKFNAENYFKAELEKTGILLKEVTALPAPGSIFNWSIIALDVSGEFIYKKNVSLIKNESTYREIKNPKNIFDKINNEFKPKEIQAIEFIKVYGDIQISDKTKELFNSKEAEIARWFLRYPVLHEYESKNGKSCAKFKDLRFDSKIRNEIPFVFSICEQNKSITVKKES